MATRTRKPNAYAEWKAANAKMETATLARPAAKPFSIFADTSSDRRGPLPTSHAMLLQDGYKDMHGYQD